TTNAAKFRQAVCCLPSPSGRGRTNRKSGDRITSLGGDTGMKLNFDPQEFALSINRRTFLGRAACGLGGLALACLFDRKLLGAADAPTLEGRWQGIVNPPHFPVRAKRIIHLCMRGGPSHVDSIDYKSKLEE